MIRIHNMLLAAALASAIALPCAAESLSLADLADVQDAQMIDMDAQDGAWTYPIPYDLLMTSDYIVLANKESLLDEKKADIGFLSYQEPMPYEWTPLDYDEMLAVLPKDHPYASKESYPLINCETDSFIMPALGRDDDVVSLFERNGIKLNIHFTTLENFATMAMIEKGLGMSVMNNLITEKWNCDVVKIPVDPPSRITLGLAVPSYKQASPAVKRFIKYAVERLKKIE